MPKRQRSQPLGFALAPMMIVALGLIAAYETGNGEHLARAGAVLVALVALQATGASRWLVVGTVLWGFGDLLVTA